MKQQHQKQMPNEVIQTLQSLLCTLDQKDNFKYTTLIAYDSNSVDNFISLCNSLTFEAIKLSFAVDGIESPDTPLELAKWILKHVRSATSQYDKNIMNAVVRVLLVQIICKRITKSEVRLFRKSQFNLLIRFIENNILQEG